MEDRAGIVLSKKSPEKELFAIDKSLLEKDFNANDWAKAFMDELSTKKTLVNYELMRVWFSCAIMAGQKRAHEKFETELNHLKYQMEKVREIANA